jgi:TPR repeat protein
MRWLLAFLLVWPIGAGAGPYEDGLRFLGAASYEKAATAFRLAATQGNAAAERQLGFMYYSGRGFKQNNSEAVSWFERAAAHGDIESQVNLGQMYENGLSIGQDDVKSAYWFRLAADGGDRRAQLRFGEICYLGTGVARDQAEAVKWWNLATEPDDALSSQLRPMIQSTMIKVPTDVVDEGIKRAREWRAARPGRNER